MKKEQKNVIAGTFFTLISIILYFFIIPMQVKLKANAEFGPEFYPKIIVILIGATALIFTLLEVLKLKATNRSIKDGLSLNIKNYISHIIFIGATVLFLFIIKYLGFVISAILLLIFLLFHFGSKDMLKNVMLSVIYIIFVYLVFSNVLKVSFPDGIFGI